MSYRLYHTDGFVLGSRAQGEGSKILSLLTREFGFVAARATSAREERSKLRYGLQDFSYSHFTLVRGKDSWRITNAALTENLYSAFRDEPETALMFARVFRLLRRLLAGEEKSAELFAAVAETFLFLKKPRTPNRAAPAPSFLAEVEIILALRILHLLGYLAPRDEYRSALSDFSLWSDALLADARSFRSLALSEINLSLKASQL